MPYNRITFLRATKKIYGTVKVAGRKRSKTHIPINLRQIEELAKQDAKVTRKVKLSVAPNLKMALISG